MNYLLWNQVATDTLFAEEEPIIISSFNLIYLYNWFFSSYQVDTMVLESICKATLTRS